MVAGCLQYLFTLADCTESDREVVVDLLVCGNSESHSSDLLKKATWIWLDHSLPHQYVCFKKSFFLDELSDDSRAWISVDSDFILSINDVEVAYGQFSDYPERKTYTTVDVSGVLKAGDNLITVFAYYRGEDFSDHRAGVPGLLFALRCGNSTVLSDSSWQSVQHPAFTSGPMPRVTGQMGFTTCYDARFDLCLQEPDWQPANLQAVGVDGFWKEIVPRPVPSLVVGERIPGKLVAQGDIYRTVHDGTFAYVMSRDALVTLPSKEVFNGDAHTLWNGYRYFSTPPYDTWLEMRPPESKADGRFVIVDIGREEVGFLTFCVDAPAGTVLDIAHGEHLDDGRVRAYIGGRNFADRYICREGINSFTLPFRRIGARYIEIHFTSFDRPLRLNYIGIRPVELGMDQAGSFKTGDDLANRIYQVGVRTLHLCMHEHYEDCPWREQSLYAFDSRNQALFGYYAFGNYDFAAASFDLLGKGTRDDGLLELCAPARVGVTIPVFSLVWVTALADHWLHSGDGRLFGVFADQIRLMLDRMLGLFDEVTGLYFMPTGDDKWQFYEWREGLTGPIGGGVDADRLDAPYNLFLHETLGSYAWMLRQSGRDDDAREVEERRERLGSAIFESFWNEEQKAIGTYLNFDAPPLFADLVQCLALWTGVVPQERREQVLEGLYSGRFVPMTLSSRIYEVLALMGAGSEAREFIDTRIRDEWGKMVFSGATSFWETALGGDDFDNAGSLCHGWSSLPVYYYQSHVLGIRPVEPGFRRFLVSPYTGYFKEAAGSVPTPEGPIHIKWTCIDGKLQVSMTGPGTLQPVVCGLPESPISRAIWNGAEIA